MLAFAAFVPVHPILLPSIGAEHKVALSFTLDALETLKQHLKNTPIDTMVVIAYPKKYTSLYGMQFAQEMKGTLKDFGDFATTLKLPCDYVLGHALKQAVHHAFPVHISGGSTIIHTVTVPLLLLGVKAPCTVMVVEVCSQSLAEHARFGELMARVLQKDSRRIGVLATGDLSHTGNETFDRKVVQLLSEQPNTLLAISETDLREAQETGLRSLAVLMGITQNLHIPPSVLSYERPLGVGHLVMHYPL